ncbi:MAG: hypothetical protein ACYTG0_12575 [Planctomycetota bacterium]
MEGLADSFGEPAPKGGGLRAVMDRDQRFLKARQRARQVEARNAMRQVWRMWGQNKEVAMGSSLPGRILQELHRNPKGFKARTLARRLGAQDRHVRDACESLVRHGKVTQWSQVYIHVEHRRTQRTKIIQLFQRYGAMTALEVKTLFKTAHPDDRWNTGALSKLRKDGWIAQHKGGKYELVSHVEGKEEDAPLAPCGDKPKETQDVPGWTPADVETVQQEIRATSETVAERLASDGELSWARVLAFLTARSQVHEREQETAQGNVKRLEQQLEQARAVLARAEEQAQHSCAARESVAALKNIEDPEARDALDYAAWLVEDESREEWSVEATALAFGVSEEQIITFEQELVEAGYAEYVEFGDDKVLRVHRNALGAERERRRVRP